MSTSRLPRAALLAVLGLVAVQARGEDPAWRTGALVAGRMNPVALATDVELAWQRRLYDAAHPALSLNQVRVAGAVELTPASISPSVNVDVQPLSILALGVGYAPVYFTGGFGLAQSYPSPRARLGGGAFREVADGPGGPYRLLVHRLLLRGALQARVKDLAVRAGVEATRFEARLHGGDRVVYDGDHDLLVDPHGWAAQADLDLAWIRGEDLVLGLRTTLVTAWYPPAAFPAGDRGRLRERTTARVGPFGRKVLFRGRGGLLDEGAIIAAAQWWLAHPDRAGRSSPQAVPLAFVALQLSGRP